MLENLPSDVQQLFESLYGLNSFLVRGVNAQALNGARSIPDIVRTKLA